jgi:hypothetical protein
VQLASAVLGECGAWPRGQACLAAQQPRGPATWQPTASSPGTALRRRCVCTARRHHCSGSSAALLCGWQRSGRWNYSVTAQFCTVHRKSELSLMGLQRGDDYLHGENGKVSGGFSEHVATRRQARRWQTQRSYWASERQRRLQRGKWSVNAFIRAMTSLGDTALESQWERSMWRLSRC